MTEDRKDDGYVPPSAEELDTDGIPVETAAGVSGPPR